MRYRIGVLMIALGLILSACNLGTTEQAIPTGQPTPTPLGGDRVPTAQITAPRDGSDVEAGDQIFVTVSVSGSPDRVQLTADDGPPQTKGVVSGATSVVMDYTVPEDARGEIVLRAVAFRGSVPSEPSEITVNVSVVDPTPSGGNNSGSTGGGSGVQRPIIGPNDPCQAIIDASAGLRMRSEPNTVSPNNILTTIPQNVAVPVNGRLGDNSWWRVTYAGRTGWIFAQFTTLGGNCAQIPIISVATPTPFPTYTPYPTFTPLPQATATPRPSATPRPADLTPSNISPDGRTQLVIPAGQTQVTQTYTLIVTNLGEAATPNFTVAVTLPNGSTQDFSISGLGGGESVTVLIENVTFTAAGTYTLQYVVDSEGTVVEASEANNSGSININVVQGS